MTLSFRIFIGLLLLTQLANVLADNDANHRKPLPRLTDFYQRQALLVKGNAPAYRLTLPAQVYQALSPDELNYIGVFNEQGKLVPWQLTQAKSTIATTTEIIALGFFNDYQKTMIKPTKEQLAVYRNNASISINLKLSPSYDRFPPTALQQPGTLNAYYIDLSGIAHSNELTKLDFQWPAGHQNNHSFDVAVSDSSDFKHWRNIGNGRLVNLRQGAHAITIHQVDIDPPTGPYLRIRFASDQTIPPLKAITGHFRHNEKVTPESPWQSAALTPLAQESGYEFSTGGDFLLQQLRIRSNLGNSLGEVLVQKLSDQKWLLATQSTLAQFDYNDGSYQEQTLIRLPPSRNRRWRLLFTAESADYLASTPKVEFNWIPDILTFIRQGAGPFTLAYGIHPDLRNERDWPNWRNHPFFPAPERQSDQVQLGEKTSHTPDLPQQPTAQFSTPGLLFWLGLSLFILIMLVMIRHLIKELKENEDA